MCLLSAFPHLFQKYTLDMQIHQLWGRMNSKAEIFKTALKLVFLLRQNATKMMHYIGLYRLSRLMSFHVSFMCDLTEVARGVRLIRRAGAIKTPRTSSRLLIDSTNVCSQQCSVHMCPGLMLRLRLSKCITTATYRLLRTLNLPTFLDKNAK